MLMGTPDLDCASRAMSKHLAKTDVISTCSVIPGPKVEPGEVSLWYINRIGPNSEPSYAEGGEGGV